MRVENAPCQLPSETRRRVLARPAAHAASLRALPRIGIKDNYDTVGVPTRNGSRLNAKDEVMGFLRPSQAAVPPRPEVQRETAYHEAGHALAGILLGQKFKYVTIEPNEVSLGHCLFEPWGALSLSPFDLDQDTRRSRRAYVRLVSIVVSINLAGIAAEHLVKGTVFKERSADPSSDIMKAAERATQITRVLRRPIEPRGRSAVFSKLDLPIEVERYLLRKLEEIRLLLALNQDALGAIAESLLERTRLSYTQVRSIVAWDRAKLDLEPWICRTVRRSAAAWNELNEELDQLNREIEIKDLDRIMQDAEQQNQDLEEELRFRDAISAGIKHATQRVQDLEDELRPPNAISAEIADARQRVQDFEEELGRRKVMMIEIMDAGQRVQDLEDELRRRKMMVEIMDARQRVQHRQGELQRRKAFLAEITDARRRVQELRQELSRRNAVTIRLLNGPSFQAVAFCRSMFSGQRRGRLAH